MTRPTALIGYTGFVGGNLAAQRPFDELYNSSNIDSIAGREFDTVVVSAARAEKWKANLDPEADRAHIDELEGHLRSFSCERLVLISTVDVYATPIGVDETTPIELEGLHAYGRNRYLLEQAAAAMHPTTVLRLPGLFGPGLKKNVIFDLLNDNNVEKIHALGSFQYYDLAHVADDVDRAVAAGRALTNIVSEPIVTRDLAREVFGLDFDNAPEGVNPASYDVRTVYPGDGTAHYSYARQTVLSELEAFVAGARS